ncbi:unnamed protein product [Vicia faba]|uniref:Uncharacterized protein n=1 Tax=Vicia faba TaxID=3906 RepID=A0AAV0ZYC1_VICFA|nr:unnamed protein product [Vicia faba]
MNNKNQGNVVYGQELAHLLRDNINESTRYKKKLTTILLKKESFSFSFPTHFDVTCFSGIDNMLSNLKCWDVECRKRNSGMCDTFYTHDIVTGGQKLRSVTEVVNRLLPKEYAKLEKRKRKIKVDSEVEDMDNNAKTEVKSGDLHLPSAYVPKKKRNYKKRIPKEKQVEKENNMAISSSTYLKETLEDQNNNQVVENNFRPFMIEDKVNNPTVESISCPLEIKNKANSSLEKEFSPHEIEEKENSSKTQVKLIASFKNDLTLAEDNNNCDVLPEITEDFSEYEDLIAIFLNNF